MYRDLDNRDVRVRRRGLRYRRCPDIESKKSMKTSSGTHLPLYGGMTWPAVSWIETLAAQADILPSQSWRLAISHPRANALVSQKCGTCGLGYVNS